MDRTNCALRVTVVAVLAVCQMVASGATPAPRTPKEPQEPKIGPEDVLVIKMMHPREPDQQLVVTAGGHILHPLLGRVKVVGMKATELEKHLTEQLRDGYYVDPKLVVAVTEHRSRKVLVSGAAKTVGEFPLGSSMTLATLLTKVGGPAPGSAGIITVIRRTAEGKTEKKVFEIAKVRTGEKEGTFELKPGDLVYFTKTRDGLGK